MAKHPKSMISQHVIGVEIGIYRYTATYMCSECRTADVVKSVGVG